MLWFYHLVLHVLALMVIFLLSYDYLTRVSRVTQSRMLGPKGVDHLPARLVVWPCQCGTLLISPWGYHFLLILSKLLSLTTFHPLVWLIHVNPTLWWAIAGWYVNQHYCSLICRLHLVPSKSYHEVLEYNYSVNSHGGDS